MINSARINVKDIASHYNELDVFYREVWGNHVHHGYWKSGLETPEEATVALIDFMIERMPILPGSKVCDVGCGYGETSRYLAKKFESELNSFTIAKVQYDFAKEVEPASQNPKYILEDWLRNSIPDQTMDTVFSIESSEHMPDFDKFFSESSRVLKSGGKLAIFAWLESDSAKAWEKQMLLQGLCDEGRMRLATVQEYEQRLKDNGMKLLSFDDISNKVSKTWTICIQRGILKFFKDPKFRSFLLSANSQNREFAKSLIRIRVAFATGAMKYGLFVAEKL